jgi:hypothetical protein
MTWLLRKRAPRGARYEPVSTVYRPRANHAPSAACHAPVAHCAAAVIGLVWLVTAAPVSAGHRDRPQDEIWLVSTRHIGSVRSESVPDLHTQRYDPDAGWQSAKLEDATRPAAADQIVVIYVHGNRLSGSAAAVEGRHFYHRLTNGLVDPVSIRYVIWSWPSDQRRGALRDVRTKAWRTELSGYCLGWFLAQFPDRQRVSVLGYSFGARIATGAVHLMAGGRLAGRVLPPLAHSQVTPRVVMVAAAVHNTWLQPTGYHALAPNRLDYLLNLYNSCDPVLKRYRALEKRVRPVAAGFAGLAAGGCGRVAP